MFLINIYLYSRWNIIKLINVFLTFFYTKMVILALIIPSIQYFVENQIINYNVRGQWYKNIFISSFHLLKNYKSFKITYLKICLYTIIFFFMFFITNIFSLLFVIANKFLNGLRIYHYILTSILENIFNYSDKYTTQFKNNNTWISLTIYKTIKAFYALRMAFLVFDLFFKGTFFWVYKKIEPKVLTLVEYYYKRTINGHFAHFKVFLYVVVFNKS